jgi:hypothetical protein
MSNQQIAKAADRRRDESRLDQLSYDVVAKSFKVITTIFFREIRATGVHQVPTDKPCIFIVAPHANQVSYIDNLGKMINFYVLDGESYNLIVI